ncbi:MAG: class I SAM-dependent methyltransferase [Bacteroidota bacterium]
MKTSYLFLISLFLFPFSSCQAQPAAGDTASESYYTQGKVSRGGYGRYYMGRQIAYVMGHLGASWLEREEREEEENVSQAIANMELQGDEVVADIGAGSGYYSFRIAKKLPKGKVLAVDLQPEMLDFIKLRVQEDKISNVEPVQAQEDRPNLKANSIDMAFMVDVYHELSYPREVMEEIVAALKPGGRFILLEYRLEDPTVPIKRLHKMTQKQSVKEMEAVGLTLKENKKNLPWQHFMVFVKR